MMTAETVILVLLLFCALWDMLWKGIAMWRAARKGQNIWYICLLVFNTLGILPIIYLAFFSGLKMKPAKKKR